MAEAICLILHRKSANEPKVKQAVDFVQSKDIDLRVRIPWNKKDKARVVKEALAAGAKRIIAGGGDGTVNGVVAALVGKGKKSPRAVMGILPLGTANDFAHGCGLPVEDLDRCLEIACTAPARQIDVGRLNSRPFLNVASGGFGAEITATTPVDMKKALGGGAYTIMGLIKAFDLQPYRGRLLVPGEEPREGAMLVMAVGNNRLAGGGFEVAPKARLDDGLLDLAIVLDHPAREFGRLASELRHIDNPENEYVFYRQLAEFELESEQPVHVNLDGEPIRKRHLRFSVLPKHLGVVF
ncbi:MAG: lipid kinase YegS [Planctomycetota bacterium]|nr:MAG: lipid kinase YegS [Planctomycetota bacterium]